MIGELALETVLMHDPVTLLALRGPPPVEHERLLHSNQRAGLRAVNLPVLPRGLPVTGLRGPVCPQPRRVLAITQAVEVPLLLPHLRLPYKRQLAINTRYTSRSTQSKAIVEANNLTLPTVVRTKGSYNNSTI